VNIHGLERSRAKIRDFLPALLRRGDTGVSLSAAVVQLIDSPRRLPATPIEQRLSSALKETGPILLVSLVKRVAAELYNDELRQGAGVLDIGLIGDRLFNRDIIRALDSGNGILWEIKQPRKSV
jgi:hypothetical protein